MEKDFWLKKEPKPRAQQRARMSPDVPGKYVPEQLASGRADGVAVGWEQSGVESGFPQPHQKEASLPMISQLSFLR